MRIGFCRYAVRMLEIAYSMRTQWSQLALHNAWYKGLSCRPASFGFCQSGAARLWWSGSLLIIQDLRPMRSDVLSRLLPIVLPEYA